MDNNPVTPTPTVIPSAPTPGAPTGAAPSAEPKPQIGFVAQEKSAKKSGLPKPILLALVFVVLLLLAGGGFLYINNQNQKKAAQMAQEKLAAEQKEIDSLNSEIDAMEKDNVEEEFVDVDKDLQNL